MTTQTTPELTERVSRLEGAYEQVNERLNDLTQAVASLRAEISSLRAELGSLRNSIFMMMGGMWVTTMGAIIGLYVTR